ncbi:nucleoprotein TPR [Copidosoma floridanum]|uniref:nucleoprotein TPR n=1 Tax=Copidosoma floridanum TaxID=29053 RepID=UPI0006C9515B|nr:nucleoprotein TPR [Copidosoma floridanum]
MESNEQCCFKMLQECLSSSEITQISVSTCKKLNTYYGNKLDELYSLKAINEINRKNSDQKIIQLTEELRVQKEELIKYQQNYDSSEKFASDIQNQLSESRNVLCQLQDNIKRLEKDNLELRRQKDSTNEENYSLHLQVQQKNSELERLKTEITALSSQLESAIIAKCQALAIAEEVKSQEISLDFREKRIEQERILFSQQISSLEEELTKKTNELHNVRSESSSRVLIFQTKLSQCEEELKITIESLEQLRECNSSLQRRSEELTKKLDDQRNHELSMHASYREEVSAQTRLADLYKGMMEEAESKANDYSNAVKELKNLLDHATEKYGNLESKFSQNSIDHTQEILHQQKMINELSKELNDANNLIQSFKQERLDQTVEQLAPAAAVASKILKKGLSLTQIYTKLVEVTNDLHLEKEENEKLKSQMEIILRELEEKAPVLQQQRKDYETAVSNISTLTLRIDELLTENSFLQENKNEAKRLANHNAKENQRLKSEVADLARQVCYLLKEVQENRTGMTLSETKVTIEANTLPSSQIISKKLVTFKDIEELQENNQKLLAIVRTLSSRQEEIEKTTDQVNSGELKKKLDRYIAELSDMQISQDRQAKMLESLIKQRDMYKNMCQQHTKLTIVTEDQENSKYSNTSEKLTTVIEPKSVDENNKIDYESSQWKIKYHEMEEKLKLVSQDLQIYKKDKMAHERMLNDEIERLRIATEKCSADCCRYRAQLDSANERFILLQENVTTYKNQIKVLEEKCNNYSTTIGKHEQSLMLLKDEALAAQSNLSKAEVQLDNLTRERQLLRDSEGRLLKEREVLKRERHTHALLKADVEVIKASLERVQAESQLRTEQRLDDATRECAALRRRLQEEQDRFREVSLSVEQQLTMIKEQLTEEKNLTRRIQNELDASRLKEQDYLKKIEDLNSQLKLAIAAVKPVTGEDNLSKKLKELEMDLSNSQAEIKSLSDQLKAARFQGQQYCDIAESSEMQLRESLNHYNIKTKEFEDILSNNNKELCILKEKNKELEDKLTQTSSNETTNNLKLEQKLSEAEVELEEFIRIKNELEQLKTELQNACTAAACAEEKYAREMVLHSNDLQVLTKLKEENQVVINKISKLTQQKDLAEETLLVKKSFWQEQEKSFKNEINELQSRVEDLNMQNEILHSQIQEVSEKAVIMSSQQDNITDHTDGRDPSESLNRSFNNENTGSVEQLLLIIKYLRREKDLTVAKLDVLKSENIRLKSQVELSNKRFEEMKISLDRERENNEIGVLTVTKHSELLRKVETLNAITDSNRVLREERDALMEKVKVISGKLNVLTAEVVPLREKTCNLETKVETLQQENNSLKSEATRWRQRANALVERANKASPEDWRRLQTERENLSKLLTSERETFAKCNEELNVIKNEKIKLEEHLKQVENQLVTKAAQVTQMTEGSKKLNQDLNNYINELNEKVKEISILKKDLATKDVVLSDLKNKEIQIRKIAKKYKTQYEELTKTVEENKKTTENTQSIQTYKKNPTNEEEQTGFDRDETLTMKLEELNQQILITQSESENLKKEIEVINKTSLEKEERAKLVLKNARTKIMQLTEYKKLCEKEMLELKEKLDLSSNESDSNKNEYEARLAALKSQMESRISRLEHERLDLQTEKEALLQRNVQLQRQLSGQNNNNAGTNEPPTANIKPMSARTETPLASIRPMSVVVQSRTAAVLPTTAGAPLLLAAQQQQIVHTTETSSPTSSHTDYQPASTSRQLAVPPQLSESAESTQREESEIIEPINPQQQQQQCPQQTIALVSPRVEQQQQQSLQPTLSSDQQQTVPSSSTQPVSTSHTLIGNKRTRTLESSSTALTSNENVDGARQEQSLSPKCKRSRQLDLASSTPVSVSDIEYQVPTSSQRDQDEEGDDACVIIDCDEGETHNPQDEEFENDAYEEIEEELRYNVEVEGDNNEVEIVNEEDSPNVEEVRQVQTGASNDHQQQSEAISSAGNSGETQFSIRSLRGIVPVSRQQPQQHLLLPQQAYEEIGDDCIVPSTPTLFVPRRSDGFGEAINSPQVPQNRFVFGETSIPVSSTLTSAHTSTSASNERAMYNPSTSGLAQVVQEGMDDTRVDLTQMDEISTEQSAPTIPQQISPTEHLISVTSGSLHKKDDVIQVSNEPLSNTCQTIDKTSSTVRVESIQEQEQEPADVDNLNIGLASEESSTVGEEKLRQEVIVSVDEEDDVTDIDTDTIQETTEEAINEDNTKETSQESEASPSSNTRQRTAASVGGIISSVRGATARRSTRTTFRTSRGTRLTPIIWDNQTSSRGQGIIRSHTARGSTSDSIRVRGARGRRIRSKYPYNY